jgi:hypothetical protein
MWQIAKTWVRKFIAADNSEINTGTVFAVVGFVTGWLVVVVYAFVLRQDIGSNMANVLMALMGVSGGGFIASLFQKYGGTLGINLPGGGEQKDADIHSES